MRFVLRRQLSKPPESPRRRVVAPSKVIWPYGDEIRQVQFMYLVHGEEFTIDQEGPPPDGRVFTRITNRRDANVETDAFQEMYLGIRQEDYVNVTKTTAYVIATRYNRSAV